MKIKFINRKDRNSIKPIDSFYLSKTNPRYTLIDNINIDLAKFIIQGNGEDYNEKNVFSELLEKEGDFSDLVNLLNSIYEKGFTNYTEPLYVVAKNDNHYVVAEGNRRLMCLKLISNFFSFNSFAKFKNDILSYANEKTEQISEGDEIDNDSDDEIIKKARQNYHRCEKLLKEITKKYTHSGFECHFEIVENSDEIWRNIYDKHLTGERPGLRKWSRSKYFADLISMFPNGIYENDASNDVKFFSKIMRDLRQIKNDYKNALFVYSIIYAWEEYEFNNDKPICLDKQNVLKEMIRLRRPSALEKIHSYNKIEKLACNEILKISKEQFKQEYFSFDFDKTNCLITFKSGKTKTQDILKFIYDKWKKQIITTRPIKDDDIVKIKNELSVVLQGKDINNYLTKEQLEEINEFDLSLESLTSLIKANEHHYTNEPYVLDRFIDAREIKASNKKILEITKEKFNKSKIEPKYVFNWLLNQLNWIDEHFIHAKAATMRALIEQLILWMYHYNLEDESSLANHVDEMTNENVSSYRNKIFKKINDSMINEWIDHFTSIEKDDEKEKIRKLIKDDKVWSFLNSCVHSFHKLYIDNRYLSILEQFSEKQKELILLLNKIDLEKFNKLNDLVIARIDKNNH